MARVFTVDQVVAEGGGGTCNCLECRNAYRYPTKEAVDRAEELLKRFLKPKQRLTWEKHGYIDVKGSQGNRYRLHPSSPMTYSRVIRLAKLGGHPVGLGVWPRGLQIAADWVLAMMLYLQEDESRVYGLACRGTPYVDY